MRRTITSRKQGMNIQKQPSQYQQTDPIAILQTQQTQQRRTMHPSTLNSSSTSPSLSNDYLTSSKQHHNSQSPKLSPRSKNIIQNESYENEMKEIQSYNLILHRF